MLCTPSILFIASLYNAPSIIEKEMQGEEKLKGKKEIEKTTLKGFANMDLKIEI